MVAALRVVDIDRNVDRPTVAGFRSSKKLKTNICGNRRYLRFPRNGPGIPECYLDVEFVCRDCGRGEVWTVRRQKVYYEELGGEIEGRPVRCAACRRLERERKAEVTRSMREGMRQRRSEACGDDVGGTL